MKRTLLAAIILCSTAVQAQTISFGKIESPKDFQKYWGLTQEQMNQYEQYMEIAGKYRHQSSNPLVVLSIISETPEDKGFYAAKAAAYEHKMSQAEIRSAWLITQEMERQGLDEAMQVFSDKLTGIDTASYAPIAAKQDWQKDDEAVLVINKTCYSTSCIKGFLPLFSSIPAGVNKSIVLKDKVALSADVVELLELNPSLKVSNYDPIEHHYLDGVINQAVQVRDATVVRKF